MKRSPTEIKNFQEALLTWYEKNKKALPWRETKDPYKIWISEIMSQQTQVETVIPYYERFLAKFPTLKTLAEADDAELLKLWEGLGYYSRARNLKAGAQEIVEKFGAVFPSGLEEIRSIKGIGPYSAASISSICFGLAEPAIDGNLFRVSSRLFMISDDISKASSRKVFDEALRVVISLENPGDFNQALMDIGATICKPKSPKCEICPLAEYCQARETGSQENFPVKSAKIKQVKLFYQAFALQLGDKWLMSQRPDNGLLASMWTFPMLEVATEDAETQLPQDLRGLTIKTEEIGRVSHVFSHQKWQIRLFSCRLEEGQVAETAPLYNAKWASQEELKKMALAGPQIKLFKLLKEN